MDFPMLDETMERHGQVLDHETSEEGGQRAEEQRVNEQRVNEQRERYEVHHQEIQDDPSRWWLASSAFPMIAGTMGPVASAFSICALVRPWRQHLPPGTDIQDGIFVADPVWLTVVNAIQLVVAVVSNVFLLLNMARRVRFAIAQPITIVGWYISAICLVCLVAAGARELLDSLDAPKDEYVWSQAFWYGVWAALLYFIVATLMAVTVYGAHEGHYPQNFNLTNSQRTLMLQTMMVLAYLLIGAVVFSKLEGWSYLDGVYWSCVTILTVGFGEFTLTNLVARWLLLPYALVGIISLGLVIGSIRSLVIDRGRRKIEARVIEMARRRYLRKMAKAGKDDILAPIREDGQDPSCSGGTSREFLRRRAEFELMRKIQADAARRRRWVALGSSAGTWAVLWLIGAKVFQEAEKPYQNWRFGNGVYFTYVTLTTIGYGDTVPISNCGKSFFVFWALLALPTTTVLISNAGDTVVKFVCDVTIQGGKVTILPGENSFAQETRNLVNRLSCGRLFKNLNSTQPSSSPMSNNDPNEKDAVFGRDIEHNTGDAQQDNADHSDGPQASDIPTANRKLHSPMGSSRDPKAPLPTGAELHCVLIEEIARVTADFISHDNKREYTFDEWAWYLKLLGEDEASAETHRRVRTPRRHNGEERIMMSTDQGGSTESSGQDQEHGQEKWSWVGRRSPLIGGGLSESGWILQHLTARLQHELSETRASTTQICGSVEQEGTSSLRQRGDGDGREQDAGNL